MRVTEWLYLVGSRQFGLSSRYDCHIYALRSPEGILLVDTGSGMGHGHVMQNLREEFGDLSRGTILVTHKHPDHSCGAARLHRELGWPVATSVYTAPILTSGNAEACGLAGAQRAGVYPAELRLEPCPVGITFDDGDEAILAGFQIRAIRVRGHSEDSFAFAFEQAGRRCLFSADIVFYGGVVGLINAPDSSMNGYLQDLEKLAGRDIDVLLPGHGLFTMMAGQIHIDRALREIRHGFIPRTIGQGDLIF